MVSSPTSHLDYWGYQDISQVKVVLRTISQWTSTPTKDFRDRSSSGFQSEISHFIEQLSKYDNLSPFDIFYYNTMVQNLSWKS